MISEENCTMLQANIAIGDILKEVLSHEKRKRKYNIKSLSTLNSVIIQIRGSLKNTI